MKRRVFLTGGAGFVGRNVFERCHDDDIYLYERDEGISGLLSFEPEVIIHCAGEIYDTGKMFNSNVKLTYNLLEASRLLHNLKAFVYLGSSSEYGRKDEPMKETDFLDPTNLYEATKGAGSLLCQSYARTYGVPVMVARPFSLYGRYEPEHRFIPTLIKSARAGWEMKIAPGVHDYINIDDFLDAIFLLISKPQPGEIYNFGSGVQMSNDEMVSLVEELVGRKIIKKPVPKMHEYDTDTWVADITKAKSLGWKPKISLWEGIAKLCHHS
jgi:nucleoside-diphosphate-sugar epimerase